MKQFYTPLKAAFFILFMAFSLPLPIFSGLFVSIQAQTVTQSWAVLASGRKPAGPSAIAIDASGNVYTLNQNNNTVSKITSAGVVTQFWASLPGPQLTGIAVDASGNVYTTDYFNSSVSKTTSAGVTTQNWAQVGSTEPNAIAIDAAGNVYTTSYKLSAVMKITSVGAVLSWAELGTGPSSIAIDASGNVYTANYDNNTVSKITSAGVVTRSWAALASGTGPSRIAIDASGNVYTINRGNNTISKITSAGVVTQSWAALGTEPNAIAIAIDASGNVYTANYDNNTVSKITSAGVVTQSWAALAFGASPRGIAIDASGNVYTANSGKSTVSKITSAAVLPVELLSFSGKNTEGSKNHLTWQTASEVNNKGFNVERLMDNGQWIILGFKTANNKASTYTFTDNAPLSTSYYRLRQLDNDGKETLSKVISIQSKGKGNRLSIYPNPVFNTLTLENTEGSDFQVLNLLGQQVLTGKTPSGGRGLDVSALPQGTYFLKVGTEQAKFVKQ